MTARRALESETRSSFARLSTAAGWMMLGVVVAAAVAFALASTLGGYHVTRVLSNSMQPMFSAGDLVIVKDSPVSAVTTGDVVVLPDPNSSNLFIHRIGSVDRNAGHTTVTTRGDNNPAPDAWLLDITSQTVPAYVAAIPTAGLSLPVLPAATSQLLLAAGLGIITVLLVLPSATRPSRAVVVEAK